MKHAFCAIFALALLCGCGSDERSEASAAVIASTVYVRVSDKVFAVAVGDVEAVKASGPTFKYYAPHDEDVGRTDAERLARDGSNAAEPIIADYLTITPADPQDRLLPCQKLPTTWRCAVKRSKLPAGDLPQRVTFVEPRFALKNMRASSFQGESVPLAPILPFSNSPERLSCNTDQRFCSAAIEITHKLVAIWTVWGHDKRYTSASDMAKRQSLVITRLVNGS